MPNIPSPIVGKANFHTMPSLASPVLDRDEYSFKRMWEEAQIRFQERTSKSLRSSAGKSLEDVLKELEEKYPQEDIFQPQGESKSNAKDVVRNVLNCINILGGIVAQGASMAFGGAADICHSAVSFLIEMHARKDRLYEGLAQLFEEISTFLKTFKIYKRIEKFKEVDPELKRITGRLMVSFVDICALSIKLLSGSKWKKFKTVAKVALLDDDSGVRDELEKFKGLVDQSSRISDAVTLEAVMVSHDEIVGMLKAASRTSGQQLWYLEGISSGVSVLKAEMDEHKLRKAHTESIEKMLKKLSITSETVKASMKSLEDARSNPVPQSGLWLRSIGEYKRWVDAESREPSSILLLNGGPSTGKSFLIGGVIEELEFLFRDGQNTGTRAFVAYYCFSQSDKKMEKSSQIKNPHIPTTALKSMAIRIAEPNIPYSKEMASILETKSATEFENMSCQDLWNTLQLSTPKSDTMHYLIFDGLEVLTDNHANDLFDLLLSVNHPRVRILVSTNGVELDSAIQTRLTDKSIPRIEVESHNHSDIRMFIERYISQNGDLFGQDLETTKLKAWVDENLPGMVGGNFSRLDTALEQLTDDFKRSLSAEDIMQNLKNGNFSQDPTAAATHAIARLNKSLNDQEIDQLNEMLIWTIYGMRYLNIDELGAALFLRFKFRSAQPLLAQLKEKGKYEPIFTIKQDQRVETREDVRSILTKDASSRRLRGAVSEKDRSKISMTIEITDADFQSVQRFFWDLSERALFDPFTFKSLKPIAETQRKIYLSEADAHLTMTLQSLDVLLAEPNENTAAIVPYALLCLPLHLERLKEFADDGQIDKSEKSTVVDKLVNLLSDASCIEKHWNRDYSWFSPNPQIFTSWLRDTGAVESLRPRDRRWLEPLVSGADPKRTCLEDIATMVAENWLRRRDWKEVTVLCDWIYNYRNELLLLSAPQDEETKINTRDGSMDTIDSASNSGDPDYQDKYFFTSRIRKAADWVQEHLGIKTKDSMWFERLGLTFIMHNAGEEAISAYQQAKDFPDVSRKSIQGLARSYVWLNDDFQLAIDELTPVVETLRTRKSSHGLQPDEKNDLLDCLRDLATWYIERPGPGSNVGIALLQEILELDPGDYTSRWALYRTLVATDCADQAFELLTSFTLLPDQRVGTLDQVSRMLFSVADGCNYARNLDTFDLIISMTTGKPMATLILEKLKPCIDIAQKENKLLVVLQMLYFEGNALFRYNLEERHSSDAETVWKRCCSVAFMALSDSDDTSYWRLISCFQQVLKRLSLHYHSAAKRSGDDANEHFIELQELHKMAQRYQWISESVVSPLAAYYVSSNAANKARDLLINDMKTGLELLSDNDPGNDHLGYLQIAHMALHSGDDLTSLSAWSLLVPDDVDEVHPGASAGTEHEKLLEDAPTLLSADSNGIQITKRRSGKLNNICDGTCGTSWPYADDMWCCKVCADVQFEAGCLEKLRNGTLRKVVCRPDHEWLHVPPFSDEEYHKVGKGRVLMGGTLVNGKREGGVIVPISEWLDTIRDDWGIPKEVKSNGEAS